MAKGLVGQGRTFVRATTADERAESGAVTWQLSADGRGRFEHKTVALESIDVRKQVRMEFDPEAHAFLVESIRTSGVMAPLLLNVDTQANSSRFVLVAGERRYRAALEAGVLAVPAMVVKDASELEILQMQLVENEHREGLTELEQARGGVQLLAAHLRIAEGEVPSVLHRVRNGRLRASKGEAVGVGAPLVSLPVGGDGPVPEEQQGAVVDVVLQAFLGTTLETFVRRRLPLLDLPRDVLEAYHAKRISSSAALALRAVSDAEYRAELLRGVEAGEVSHEELRQRVRLFTRKPASAVPEAVARLQGLRKRLAPRRYERLPSDTKSRVQRLLAELDAVLSEAEAKLDP